MNNNGYIIISFAAIVLNAIKLCCIIAVVQCTPVQCSAAQCSAALQCNLWPQCSEGSPPGPLGPGPRPLGPGPSLGGRCDPRAASFPTAGI